MANVKISALTDATAVNDTDELPIVQAGTTKRITVAEFMAAAPQPTTTIIEDASVSKRISGVSVAWVSGLTFRVSAGTYKIQGDTYTVAQTDLTLGAADATNPRIDIIAVNTSGAAVVIAGTAAATPVKPDVDPDTQLELTFVDIAATATEPAFASSNVDVYHEGTEWTDSKSGVPITLDSLNNPLAGTKCIEATVAVTGNYIRLVAPADIDLGDYDSLVFNIRSKGAWASTRSINIAVSKTGVQRGSIIAFREGSFGFDSTNSTAYQQIVIPCSLFGAAGLSVDRIQLTVAGTGTGIGFYFDDMTLQGGTAIVSDDTKMQWRGEWNSNTLYNLNDVVKLSNVVYVALRSNTNRTPATNTSDWQVVLSATGTAGRHAIFIAAGSMAPSVTGGCASLARIASAASQPDIASLDFDTTTQEYAQFYITMPKSWDEGTVTFAPIWSHAATTTNFGVVWDLAGYAASNDDAIATAYGTAQTSTDTGGTTNDIYMGPESSAITIAGTPAAEDTVFFRVSRVTGNGSDTMAIDARLMGIVLYVVTNAETDV